MAAYAESIKVSFARTRTSRYLDGAIPAIALIINVQYEQLLPVTVLTQSPFKIPIFPRSDVRKKSV